MKKVTDSRMLEATSNPPADSFENDDVEAEDDDRFTKGFQINRPEAVGATGLAQNSNFYQKLQQAQNSLRSQEQAGGLRQSELSSSAGAASTSDERRLPSRPGQNFLPLVSPVASAVQRGKISSLPTSSRTADGSSGAIFPQDLDIVTVGTEGVGAGGAAGFFDDFDFEDTQPDELASRPDQQLFRVSSQLQVGGGGQEEEEEGAEVLRFPGTVLQDATTRKIGEQTTPCGSIVRFI